MTAKEAFDIITTLNEALDMNDYMQAVDVLEQSLAELEKLKANQVKVETVEGYGIDDVLAVIHGLKSKEITPEILHSHLLMYKIGYENGIKMAQHFIKEAFENIGKVGDKDE